MAWPDYFGYSKTVFQSLPVDGIVENMSYFKCPVCHETHYIFGKCNIEELAAKYNIKMTIQIPIDSRLAEACDDGKIEEADIDWLSELAKTL